MSQVHLHRLHIVSVLQGKDCKGVAQVVYSRVRCSDFLRNLFEVQVDSFWLQMMSDLVGKHQSLLVFCLSMPGLLRAAGQFPLFDLLLIAFLEDVHHESGRTQNADFAVFGGSELGASCIFRASLQLFVDCQRAFCEVHAVPGETQCLRFTEPGEEDHPQQHAVDIILLSLDQKIVDLLIRKGTDLRFVRSAKACG